MDLVETRKFWTRERLQEAGAALQKAVEEAGDYGLKYEVAWGRLAGLGYTTVAVDLETSRFLKGVRIRIRRQAEVIRNYRRRTFLAKNCPRVLFRIKQMDDLMRSFGANGCAAWYARRHLSYLWGFRTQERSLDNNWFLLAANVVEVFSPRGGGLRMYVHRAFLDEFCSRESAVGST